MDKKTKIVITVLSVFCVLCIGGLCASLGVLAQRTQDFEQGINSVYDSAYYSAQDGLGDIENKLYKLRLTTSPDGQRKLLSGIHSDCEVLAVHLTALQAKDEGINRAIAVVNRLGGYAQYLAAKLPAEALGSTEKAKLDSLVPVIEGLKSAFALAGEQVALGNAFYSYVGSAKEVLSDVYGIFESGTVEYPEMIYDGPFSDGLDNRSATYLDSLDVVDREVARQKALSLFGAGEDGGEYSGVFDAYIFTGEGGKTVTVTKRGGCVAEFVSDSAPDGEGTDKDTLTANAVSLLAELGYTDMQAVWVSVSEETAYVNCAYVQDGVIYYPDLIKVKLSALSGVVTGLEAENYLFNHKVRAPIEGLAEKSGIVLPEGFTAKSLRLTVIPTDGGGEQAAYEAYGEYDGADYYLYYDAKTLAEVKVMRVVNDEMRGELIV